MIRRLEEKDRAVYLAMARTFYDSDAVDHPVPDAFLTRTFDEMMARDTYAEGYLLEEDGRALGYALLAKTWSQEAGGMAVWIEELYVSPEARGKGLGSAFFAFLKTRCPAARYRLETEAENTRAKALYTRMGFRPLAYESMILDP